eukprot:m.28793 g.28793  ORF g.28793 m.28793 type:complete len:179 (+) comp6090_c0_seq1:57-593(+)
MKNDKDSGWRRTQVIECKCWTIIPNTTLMSDGEKVVFGVGAKAHPLSIVFDYTIQATGKKKRLQIPVAKHLQSHKTAQALLDVIMKRHEDVVLSAGKNKVRQVLGELVKVHEKMAQGNLNALDNTTLLKKKQEMETEFEKNKVGKESSEYVYDKQVEFTPAMEQSGWDSESGDESDDW